MPDGTLLIVEKIIVFGEGACERAVPPHTAILLQLGVVELPRNHDIEVARINLVVQPPEGIVMVDSVEPRHLLVEVVQVVDILHPILVHLIILVHPIIVLVRVLA